MKTLKRISNISKYGLGAGARERKRADKEQQRHERFFNSDLWEHGESGARRNYASYEEYVAHQASKLDKIAPRLRKMRGGPVARIDSICSYYHRNGAFTGTALVLHRGQTLLDKGYGLANKSAGLHKGKAPKRIKREPRTARDETDLVERIRPGERLAVNRLRRRHRQQRRHSDHRGEEPPPHRPPSASSAHDRGRARGNPRTASAFTRDPCAHRKKARLPWVPVSRG